MIPSPHLSGTVRESTHRSRAFGSDDAKPSFDASVDQGRRIYEGFFTVAFLDAFRRPDQYVVRTVGGMEVCQAANWLPVCAATRRSVPWRFQSRCGKSRRSKWSRASMSTSAARRAGVTGVSRSCLPSRTTNAQGIVRLKLPPLTKSIELLYVDPEVNFWGQLKRNVKVSAGSVVVNLKPLAGSSDALVHFYGATDAAVGNKIAVAVVDSGIAPHPDLVIAGGLNTVVGEDPTDYGDNGLHHGTHVAGIIAGRGAPPTGIRGLAPGVALHSYRVFGSGQGGASNYAIAKAIDAAAAAGCHLINLSLGGGPSDEATRDAIADARTAGSVVVAANGNEDRDPVSFPARDSRAIAVSAFGRKGTFPNTSQHSLAVAAPYGTDKKNFLADFSNIGPETDLTGPGVGIISTVPGGYAAWNGTSMAAPAVTGRIAALWSKTPTLLGMPASAERSAAVIEAALSSGVKLGFGADYEGNGRI